MSSVKLQGTLMSLDALNRKLTIRLDFLDPLKQEEIEKILSSGERVSVEIGKPFRRSKTNDQLGYYYVCLSKILNKLGIYPNAEIVKAFDAEIKKGVFGCEFVEVYDKKIPVPPKSKANYDIEEMSALIEYLEEHYGKLIHDDMDVV